MVQPNFYDALAAAIRARENCQGNAKPGMHDAARYADLAQEWNDYIRYLMRNFAPSGSGFDSGTILVDGNDTRIRFETSFHHMNDGGFYDGWTEHKVTVIPTFSGIRITVTGRDINFIKEYIADTFRALRDTLVPSFGDWRKSIARKTELSQSYGRIDQSSRQDGA